MLILINWEYANAPGHGDPIYRNDPKREMVGDIPYMVIAGVGLSKLWGLSRLAGRNCISRLPQDIRVNPEPPEVLPSNRSIGSSPAQNAELQADIQAARARGATDIRVNQQQVNAAGQRVGINRPDLQYTLPNGKRIYMEYDRNPLSGLQHEQRILANDSCGNGNAKDDELESQSHEVFTRW